MNYRKNLYRMYRQARPCWIVLAVLLVCTLLFKGLSFFLGPLIYYNDSPSAPIGVYLLAPDQELRYGDFVNVHQPVDLPVLHSPKGSLLLKHVAGFPGDIYTVTDSELVIRGAHYPIYPFSYLPHLAPGTYTVPDGQVLLLNPMDHSMDGRYFGTVPRGSIVNKVVLLLPVATICDTIEQTFPAITQLGADTR